MGRPELPGHHRGNPTAPPPLRPAVEDVPLPAHHDYSVGVDYGVGEDGITELPVLETEGMGVIVHLADAAVERPDDFAQFTWIGTVEPDNIDQYDIWIDIS